MNIYFLLLELFFYVFTVYIILKKEEFSIIYLPVLFFTRNIIEPSTPAIFWYMILAVIMGYIILSNEGFTRNNPYAIFLVIYFTVLLFLSSDIVGTRAHYVASVTFFLSVPLIQHMYGKYDRSIIEDEIYTMSVIILLIFISNVIMSSLTGFSGDRVMYGLSGILYGNLISSAFNIVPVVLFFIFYKLSGRYSTADMLIAVISFTFLILSMRRSVMVAAVAAGGTFMIMIMIQKDKTTVYKTVAVVGTVILITFLNTNVLDTFWERYESRGLDEGEFVSIEEGRFVEFGLVYSDMFIDRRYSPIFGYELFNSGGNYGDEIYGRRSLHSDITVIVHASGLLGLLLYVLMIIKTFQVSYQSAWSSYDRLILLFCAVVLIIFSLSGRFTSADYMIVLFLFILLPTANRDDE